MRYIILIVITLLLMTGCSGAPAASDVPDSSGQSSVISSQVQETALTEEELAWFNEQFFNRQDDLLPNQFLIPLYDSPEKIELDEIFYNYNAQLSEAECEQLAALDFFLEVDESKATTAQINEALLRYTGLTLEETERVGLDQYTYLPDFDAYYHAHGDTNYSRWTITSGVWLEDGSVKLRYEDYLGKTREATLIPNGDSYFFFSNLEL